MRYIVEIGATFEVAGQEKVSLCSTTSFCDILLLHERRRGFPMDTIDGHPGNMEQPFHRYTSGVVDA